MISVVEITAQFADAMREHGIEPPQPIIADGCIHRFRVNGEHAGKKSGAYRLFADSWPAGWFQNHKAGGAIRWRARREQRLSSQEREARRAKIREDKRKREAEEAALRAGAAVIAAAIWEHAQQHVVGSHPYLARKGVKAHGLRVIHSDKARPLYPTLPLDGWLLVVPMRDTSHALHSLQFIDANGNKHNLAHGAKKGHYHAIGKPNGTICITEGYADGASVHEPTGNAVAMAIDAHNLKTVALALRAEFPDACIVMCADNDLKPGSRNTGIEEATKAALAVGGLIAVPELDGRKCDFNDLLRERGADAVKAAIANAKRPEAAKNGRGERDDAACPPAFSDDALACEFTKRHGDELRYVAAWGKWLRWDRTRWLEDSTLAVYDAARAVCRDMAAGANDARLRRQIASAKTVAAVERLAQSDRMHAAVTGQWDADDFLLNTPVGTIDLRTGALPPRPHRRTDYLTKITGVAPDFDRKSALFEQFLDEITVGDVELVRYLQRVAGYCLTGDTREHALFFNYGEGTNGKNTFLDALQFACGDYAKTVPAETLMEARGNRHPTELANLMGIRLAISNEIEEGEHWAEARLKSLTGDEIISARFMRQDFFEFRKTHKHVIAGNHKPALRVVDEAIRRRLQLIPWRAKFDEERRDRAMAQKLRAEAGAILAWAIRGCQRWLADGLDPPEIVRNTTAQYMSAQDTFNQWLEECTVRQHQASERSRWLYTSFRLWKQARGEGALSEKRFSEQLERRYDRNHTNQGSMFSGIRLTPAESTRVSSELNKAKVTGCDGFSELGESDGL